MEASRTSDEYAAGVSLFLKFALRNEDQDRKLLCPCKNCGNRFWYDVDIVNDHLVCTKVVRIPILLPESYDLTILHHRIDPNPTMNPNRVESMLSPDPNHRIL
jgi:hypothetical protein